MSSRQVWRCRGHTFAIGPNDVDVIPAHLRMHDDSVRAAHSPPRLDGSIDPEFRPSV